MLSAATAAVSRHNPANPVNYTPRPAGRPSGSKTSSGRKPLPRPGEPRAPGADPAGSGHRLSTRELAAFFRSTAPPEGNQPPALDPPVSSAFSTTSTSSADRRVRQKRGKRGGLRQSQSHQAVVPRRIRLDVAVPRKTTGGHPHYPISIPSQAVPGPQYPVFKGKDQGTQSPAVPSGARPRDASWTRSAGETGLVLGPRASAAHHAAQGSKDSVDTLRDPPCEETRLKPPGFSPRSLTFTESMQGSLLAPSTPPHLPVPSLANLPPLEAYIPQFITSTMVNSRMSPPQRPLPLVPRSSPQHLAPVSPHSPVLRGELPLRYSSLQATGTATQEQASSIDAMSYQEYQERPGHSQTPLAPVDTETAGVPSTRTSRSLPLIPFEGRFSKAASDGEPPVALAESTRLPEPGERPTSAASYSSVPLLDRSCTPFSFDEQPDVLRATVDAPAGAEDSADLGEDHNPPRASVRDIPLAEIVAPLLSTSEPLASTGPDQLGPTPRAQAQHSRRERVRERKRRDILAVQHRRSAAHEDLKEDKPLPAVPGPSAELALGNMPSPPPANKRSAPRNLQTLTLSPIMVGANVFPDSPTLPRHPQHRRDKGPPSPPDVSPLFRSFSPLSIHNPPLPPPPPPPPNTGRGVPTPPHTPQFAAAPNLTSPPSSSSLGPAAAEPSQPLRRPPPRSGPCTDEVPHDRVSSSWRKKWREEHEEERQRRADLEDELNRRRLADTLQGKLGALIETVGSLHALPPPSCLRGGGPSGQPTRGEERRSPPPPPPPPAPDAAQRPLSPGEAVELSQSMPVPALEMSRRLHEQVLRDMEQTHRHIEQMQRRLVTALGPLLRGVQQTTQQLGGIPEVSDEEDSGGADDDDDNHDNHEDGDHRWDWSTTAASDGDGDDDGDSILSPADNPLSEILRRGHMAHQRAGSGSTARSSSGRTDAGPWESPVSVPGPHTPNQGRRRSATATAATGAPSLGRASFPCLHITPGTLPGGRGHRAHLSLEPGQVLPLFAQPGPASPGQRDPLVVQPHIRRRPVAASPVLPAQPIALPLPRPAAVSNDFDDFDDLVVLMEDLTGRRPPSPPPARGSGGEPCGLHRHRRHWGGPSGSGSGSVSGSRHVVEGSVGMLNMI